MENKIVKFNPSKNTEIALHLKHRVEEYFREKKISKKANPAMVLKILCILIIFISSYTCIISKQFSESGMFFFAMLFGFSKLLIAFNIAHDASHDALFKSRKLNYLFSYSFNLVGVNRYIWDIKHNLSHHAFTNIPGYDMDIEQIKVARLVRHVPIKWYYRFQHLYVPLLYPFASLYMICVKDFQMFATKRYGNSLQFNHPKKEYFILIFSKLFYFFYALIIPLLIIELPWWKILSVFFIMHLVLGSLVSLILFPAHALHNSPFPVADDEGLINNNWLVHQIETSTNFGVNNPILFWISGGLNIHIPHHLFPGICHIHYVELNRIVKEVVNEYGITYRENSFPGAVYSHLLLLKKMGRLT